MKAVTTITHFNGQTFWLAQRCCLSLQEAQAAEALLDGMPSPEAYIPHHAAIATADGQPTATGGGMATHYVEPGPELPPDKQALQERAMADDPAVGSLKNGEAGRDEEE